MRTIKIRKNTKWNYSYYPVIVNSEDILLKIQEELLEQNVVPRRYFYPSLNTVKYIKGGKMPISEEIAERILCLPLYVGLEVIDLQRITKVINTYS